MDKKIIIISLLLSQTAFAISDDAASVSSLLTAGAAGLATHSALRGKDIDPTFRVGATVLSAVAAKVLTGKLLGRLTISGRRKIAKAKYAAAVDKLKTVGTRIADLENSGFLNASFTKCSQVNDYVRELEAKGIKVSDRIPYFRIVGTATTIENLRDGLTGLDREIKTQERNIAEAINDHNKEGGDEKLAFSSVVQEKIKTDRAALDKLTKHAEKLYEFSEAENTCANFASEYNGVVSDIINYKGLKVITKDLYNHSAVMSHCNNEHPWSNWSLMQEHNNLSGGVLSNLRGTRERLVSIYTRFNRAKALIKEYGGVTTENGISKSEYDAKIKALDGMIAHVDGVKRLIVSHPDYSLHLSRYNDHQRYLKELERERRAEERREEERWEERRRERRSQGRHDETLAMQAAHISAVRHAPPTVVHVENNSNNSSVNTASNSHSCTHASPKKDSTVERQASRAVKKPDVKKDETQSKTLNKSVSKKTEKSKKDASDRVDYWAKAFQMNQDFTDGF